METLTAPEGAITVGWVGEGALYARFQGDLYSSLGAAYAARLEQLLGDAQQVHYFVDAWALNSYDLLARSAIVRVVLANRSRFSNIALLQADDASRQTGTSPLGGLGELLSVTRDPVEFHGRLLRVAPFASHRLNPRQQAVQKSAGPTPRTR